MKLLKIFNFLFNKRLIHQDKTKRTIYNQEKINFSSYFSYHLIVITARAKSEKQLGKYVTDDEDLIIKIDNKIFPKLNSKDLIDSPAAFSGGKLHNLAKTIYFLTFLNGGEHTITLLADKPTNTATFESLEIYTLKDINKKVKINQDIQAEDGDRRPWLTFILDNLPLRSIKSKITYSRRKQDSDDVKIKIDGEIQTEPTSKIKHFFWKFAGSKLSWEFPTKTKTKRFWPWLPQGLHYIEFYADRMPTMRKLALNLKYTKIRTEKTADRIIQNYAPVIKDTAMEFNVDPVVVAAVIYQEQATNVNFIDTLRDYIGALLYINTSIGIGQIRVKTAELLEKYYPNLKSHYKEDSFTNTNIARIGRLRNPLINVRYVAAKINFTQERWAKAGLDIQNRPEILGTLYNIEDVEKPIEPHPNPKANEFGNGVKNNYDRIKKLLIQ